MLSRLDFLLLFPFSHFIMYRIFCIEFFLIVYFSLYPVFPMCLLREIKRTGEIVKLWIQLGKKNDHTDPMEMSYLLGIAGGCLAAVLILVCLCIYAIRTRKCCFKGKFSICFLLLFQVDFFKRNIYHWVSRS